MSTHRAMRETQSFQYTVQYYSNYKGSKVNGYLTTDFFSGTWGDFIVLYKGPEDITGVLANQLKSFRALTVQKPLWTFHKSKCVLENQKMTNKLFHKGPRVLWISRNYLHDCTASQECSQGCRHTCFLISKSREDFRGFTSGCSPQVSLKNRKAWWQIQITSIRMKGRRKWERGKKAQFMIKGHHPNCQTWCWYGLGMYCRAVSGTCALAFIDDTMSSFSRSMILNVARAGKELLRMNRQNFLN